MKTQPSTDFAVIGGGLVGALLALLLSKRGFSVTLVERKKAEKPSQTQPLDTRAMALNYGTVQLLKDWGFDKILNNATYIENIHVSDKGRRGIVHIRAQEEMLPYLGAIVPIEELVYALQTEVIQNKKIQFIEGETPESLFDSKIVIGADGVNSSVRKKLGIEIDEYDYHSTALIGKVRVKKQVADCAFERFTETGPIALLPAGDCLYTLIWVKPATSANEQDQPLLESLQKAFGYRAGIFVEQGKMNTYPLKRVFSKETHRGHIGLFGNAAHTLHPVAGQGFNLSVRDILTFLEVLDMQGRLDESLWIEYEKRAHFQQRAMKTITHSFVKTFETRNPVLGLSRTLLLQCFELSSFARSELNDVMIGKF